MWSVFKTAGPHLWRYRRGLILGMGSLVLKDVVSASLPLVIRGGVDSLTSGFRIQIVFEFAAILVGLSLLKGIFQYWMRVILIGISRDIEFDL
jgi:ATP-binding cassette subfamily B multidrug efflux pump